MYNQTTVTTHVGLLTQPQGDGGLAHLTDCPKLDMFGEKNVVHVDMKFGPLFLEPSSPSGLYRYEIVVVDSILQCFQYKARLLRDECLVAGVTDARDVTHTAGVITMTRDGQVGTTLRLRTVFRGGSYPVHGKTSVK